MTGKRFENRLDKSNMKFNTLNPVWDNEKEDALNVFKMIDLLNEFDSENKKLEKENLDLSEELDYYKTKCASLETGLFQADKENEQLKSRVEYLERKINRERKSHFIQDEKWQTESTQQITKLKKENEQLKAQLYCDDEEGVCIICKHHYLKKGNIFYISKCEKGHEECSKESVRHCEDFELKECKND